MKFVQPIAAIYVKYI